MNAKENNDFNNNNNKFNNNKLINTLNEQDPDAQNDKNKYIMIYIFFRFNNGDGEE